MNNCKPGKRPSNELNSWMRQFAFYLRCHALYPDTVGSYLPKPDPAPITSSNTNGDIFQELLFEAWPRLQDPFNISSAASFTTADDKMWTWTKSMDNVQIEYDSKDGPSRNKIRYTSSFGNFNPFGGDYGFWFFLLTILSFFMLVKMIQFSTKYIFRIGILPQYKMLSDNELTDIITKSDWVYMQVTAIWKYRVVQWTALKIMFSQILRWV